jgi:hypothetical protein
MFDLAISLMWFVVAAVLWIIDLPTWLVFMVAFFSVPVAAVVIYLRGYAVWKRSDDRNLALQGELKAVQESRAKLVVVPCNTRDGFYLEVTNHGEQGELEAQIEILSGAEVIHGVVTPPNPYVGYWESAACDKALIKDGHMDRLVIGMTEYAPGFFLAEFKMVFFDRFNKKGTSFGTQSWITRGPDRAPPGPVFALRVTISATPRMPNGPFERDYLVRRGEQEALIESQTDAETNS